MLAADELQALVKRAKGARLLADGAGVPVSIGPDAIERLLPHRPPMRLVDAVDAVDHATGTVRGRRRLAPDDPGFDGHFPGEPTYPGMLTVEAMGQLGLTLLHFGLDRNLAVPANATPRRVRATHVHHAAFVAPFQPGDTMTLYAQVAHHDYTMIAIGQAWRGDVLAAFAVCEVLADE